ncbi:MAG: hypothetical protein J5533_03970 [Bacteroidales bacterium]|nr:hypothetical protein [Bacteroidales bacterium]
MDFRFSEDFLKVLEFSRDEAVRTGWHNICPDHLMLAIMRHSDNAACRALESLGVDLSLFKKEIDGAIFVSEQIPWEERDSINLSPSASSLLKNALLESAKCRSNFVEPLHFLLALAHNWGSYSHDWIEDHGITPHSLLEAAGINGQEYGLAQPGQKEAAAPDPSIMAAAIEQRILDGYSTGNFFSS